MTRSFLACTVRNCGLPLERRGGAFVCPQRHAYDIARAGYVNLLQPQDRRSSSPGDSKGAVEARANLLAAGVGRTILDRFVACAAAIDAGADPVAVDLGAGRGDALGALALARPMIGVGIELSPIAAAQAAHRFPLLTWVVANADRRLPLLDHSVDIVLSLHGRRNPVECARVLTPAGILLVAVPAPEDLIELRALVQGEGRHRERGDTLLAEHAPLFALSEHTTMREQHSLGPDSLHDLLRGTYRSGRAVAAERVKTVSSLEVTVASEFFLFTLR